MSEDNKNFFAENRETIVFLALAIIILLLYWQTTGFQFINLDDNAYVYENPVVLSGFNTNSVYWSLVAFHAANWHPLTWLSHIADVQMFGLNAGAHHATNVIFHLINSILAFVVFRKMTGAFWKSAIIAALFAVHPVHVESVAWVAERKDVLSTMFWLLTMFAYLHYVETKPAETPIPAAVPEKKKNKKQKPENESSELRLTEFSATYLLLILVFALGLTAKPMLVTLPFVLVLIDYWTLERLKTLKDLPLLLLEKLPLFALSAVSCVITIFAQRSGGAIQSLEVFPLDIRLLNTIISYARYVVMLFYPFNLSVWYPYDKNFAAWQIVGAIVLLGGITALCVWQRNERKYLLMGWLWFLGTLVPVIGIIQVGAQPIADRYTYVPYFGLFIMLVWGLSEFLPKLKFNQYAIGSLAAVILLGLSLITYRQISYWRDDETTYSHALSVTENNYLVMQNYCNALMNKDRLDEAEKLCRDSIAINSNYSNSYNTLAVILLKRQKFAESADNFKKALELNPGYGLIYINLSVAQSLQGNPEEAEQNLEKAAALVPFNAAPEMWTNATNDLALAYANQEKYDKAAENYVRLLTLAPEKATARVNYALTLFILKKYDEAQAQIEEAIRQNPNIPESYNIYGSILLEQNKRDEAIKQIEKALQLRPDFREAQANLKKAKGEK